MGYILPIPSHPVVFPAAHLPSHHVILIATERVSVLFHRLRRGMFPSRSDPFVVFPVRVLSGRWWLFPLTLCGTFRFVPAGHGVKERGNPVHCHSQFGASSGILGSLPDTSHLCYTTLKSAMFSLLVHEGIVLTKSSSQRVCSRGLVRLYTFSVTRDGMGRDENLMGHSSCTRRNGATRHCKLAR